MMTLKKATMTAAILASFAITGMAQARIIDDFEAGTAVANDSVVDSPTPLPVTAFDAGLSNVNVIGGARDLSANMTQKIGPSSAVQTSVNAGSLQSLRSSGTRGVSTVDWDGTADGILNTTGLGGLNLMLDGSTEFELVVASDNPGGTLGLTVWDVLGHSFTSSITSPLTTSSVDYFLDFESFKKAGVDFTNIGAIQLTVDSAAARNLRIDSLVTLNGNPNQPSIPEPATMALMGLGLIGLGWTRRGRAV